MSLISQLVGCVFTYIFSFVGLYVWNIDAPLKWLALLPFVLALVMYVKFTFEMVKHTAYNLATKNWFYILSQLLLICLNVFILVYVINSLL